jgi:hypothetical protein
MKSYFAKLAARATLTNVTATAAVNATDVADPFEQTSLSQPLSATAEALKSDRSGNEPEKVHQQSEVFTTPAPDSWNHATTLLPKLPSALSLAERTSNSLSDIPRSKTAGVERQTEQTERQTTESGSRGEALPQLTPSVAISLPHSPMTSDEAGNPPVNETDDNQAQLADLQREQTMLLRKADVFMERLFDRRSQSEVKEEIDSRNESRSTVRTNAEPDQVPRLQPSPPAPREPEPDDRPSLVIGSLTVEVVPQAPPPVTPEREVVIVQAARNVGSPVPSSRRFGLAQF